MTKRLASISTTAAITIAATSATAELSNSCRTLLGGERLTIAVPNSAGGGYDTYARALVPVLEKHGDVSARVTNMPSGGGLAARSFVMNADPDTLAVLIENTGDLVSAPMGSVGRGDLADLDFMYDGYSIVGAVHVEPSAWIGRAGIDLLDPSIERLIASEGGLEEAMLPFFVTGRALGIDVDAITGYDGTGEMTAAILRGEADISSMSLTTSKRRAQDESVEILMVMSDGAFEGAPDIPYMAGEGSIVWERTAGLPKEEAENRRAMASAVASVRSTVRGLFVSTNMDQERRDCVANLMDIATMDTEFSETAAAQGRPVAALTASEAAEVADGLKSSFLKVQPVLEEIAGDLMNN